MTEQELDMCLKKALDAAAPDDFGDVLSRCEAGKGTVIDMKDMTNTGKRKTWKRSLIAACLALVVLAGGGGGLFYRQAHAVASVVSLDVNPSIELTVNKNEKVLTCKGLNADAAVVLMDMDGGHDLEGAKLDVAVNAIVGALVRSGYLDHLDSAILISVEDKDAARSERIQQELTQAVGGTLQSAANSAAVLTQSVAANTQLDAQAQQNNISTGKAYLVEQVLAINPDLTFEDLAALSVEELRDLIGTGAPDMPIGRNTALQAVLDSLGLTQADVAGIEVDPELDERTPYYEVELLIDGREQDFGVHAYTGEVIQGVDIDTMTGPGPAMPGTDASDVGEAAAKAAALAKAGLTEADVTWIKVKREVDDGRVEYDIEFRTDAMEYDCTVDGATGGIGEWDTDPIPGAMTGPGPAQPEATKAPAADVGEAAAKAAALAQAGLTEDQITWGKVKRDIDDGKLEYEVEFRTDYTEYECTVDGTTGGILDWDAEPAVIPAKSTPAPAATKAPASAKVSDAGGKKDRDDDDDDDRDDHDDDDDDDDDDDRKAAARVTAPSTPAPAVTKAPAPAVTKAPAPAVTKAPAPVQAPAQTWDDDDDDHDDDWDDDHDDDDDDDWDDD